MYAFGIPFISKAAIPPPQYARLMDTRGLSLKFYGGKRSKLALDPLLSPPPYIDYLAPSFSPIGWLPLPEKVNSRGYAGAPKQIILVLKADPDPATAITRLAKGC